MSQTTSTIIYTKTDEAPALATHSLLPILRAYSRSSGIEFEVQDISLAGRIIASFPERLTDAQRQNDALTELGELATRPEANIIKLPNISASIPQLKAAVAELKAHGYDLPEFPEEPQNDAEREVRERYGKVLGSAVNPVLREGNSDRRVAAPVKAYAMKNPHSMGAWSKDSKSHVAHMDEGDFFSSEQSRIVPDATEVRIAFEAAGGGTTVLRAGLALQAGEVIDAAVMSKAALCAYLEREIDKAKEEGVLLSLHLKATMMKVSDPILFGHMVKVYYRSAFEKHAALFERLGVDANNGIGDVYNKIADLPAEQKVEVEADLQACYQERPALAMVDSDRGITNLHVPSDVIIDASMPAAIRASGQMWGSDGELHDTKALIPDRSYAGVYQQTIDFCKTNGAFDVTVMGNVSNVGLMAQKAEEYGSHDKTFEMEGSGTVRVVDAAGQVLLEHSVEEGDIWRMCQTKDAPIQDWVKLAVNRARATGAAAIFWLNKDRAHDANLIQKVEQYLPQHDTDGLDIRILAPAEATWVSCERARDGKDSISVTGNVLRDYLTDLFPILELGTSAKMLSIVPLLAGGGLYETGAGGSAPKHVQQFEKEGHLRWDSLGEFLAIGASLEDLGMKTGNARATLLGNTLNQAIGVFLDENKSPSRKVMELDNRGSHFYLAMYWAQALAAQSQDAALSEEFKDLAAELTAKEQTIVDELNAAQGNAMDVGGYFQPDDDKASAAMRPSATFNSALESFTAA